jgi:N-acetylornithine carbamoyltransferase
MAAMRGMDVTVVRPDGFELPPSIMDKARQAARLSGGSVHETNNRAEAYEGAHVIYAKEWSSTKFYGDRVADQKLREPLQDWILDEPSFATAQKSARFMHCLPVRRGVAVTDRLLDGPRSVVIHEAQNRMWGQMAVVYQMMGPGV